MRKMITASVIAAAFAASAAVAQGFPARAVSQDKATPAALQNHLRAEIAKWGPITRNAAIYAD